LGLISQRQANRKRTADIDGDYGKPSRDGNCTDDEIPLPDGDALSRGPNKLLTRKTNIHADSHAEDNKGGSESESEICEKLNRG
jgi:hypothetical protein